MSAQRKALFVGCNAIAVRMKNYLILIYLAVSFYSCKSPLSKSDDINCKTTIPFDTLEFKRNFKLERSKSLTDSIIKDTLSSRLKGLDTIDLMYISYACYCPEWIMNDKFEANDSSHTNQKYSFYIEPYNKNVDINNMFFVSYNVVRFIGKEYIEIWKPKITGLDTYQPGRKFRYYSYEILKPFKIWGPQYADSCNVDSEGKPYFHSLQLSFE